MFCEFMWYIGSFMSRWNSLLPDLLGKYMRTHTPVHIMPIYVGIKSFLCWITMFVCRFLVYPELESRNSIKLPSYCPSQVIQFRLSNNVIWYLLSRKSRDYFEEAVSTRNYQMRSCEYIWKILDFTFNRLTVI